MGRETRQTRRARERRELQQRRHKSQSLATKYSILAAGAMVAVILAVVATLAFAKGSSSSTPATVAIPTPPAFTTVDGIVCNPGGEVTTYHQHAHLEMYDAGKFVPVPDNIGFDYNYDCLHWVHTHSPSQGVIHLEAPSSITPPLKTFFDVWGRPLNSHQIGNIKVKPGQKIRVWVNLKPYRGNMRTIALRPHTMITIEVGSPFVPPQPFDFKSRQL